MCPGLGEFLAVLLETVPAGKRRDVQRFFAIRAAHEDLLWVKHLVNLP